MRRGPWQRCHPRTDAHRARRAVARPWRCVATGGGPEEDVLAGRGGSPSHVSSLCSTSMSASPASGIAIVSSVMSSPSTSRRFFVTALLQTTPSPRLHDVVPLGTATV
jgi:hypothetical protein